MSHLVMKPSWSLTLDTEELRLITKALSGRLRPDELESAAKLGDEITEHRIEVTRQHMAQINRLDANVKEAQRGK